MQRRPEFGCEICSFHQAESFVACRRALCVADKHTLLAGACASRRWPLRKCGQSLMRRWHRHTGGQHRGAAAGARRGRRHGARPGAAALAVRPPGPACSARDACSGCSMRCSKHQAACLPLHEYSSLTSVCRPARGTGAGRVASVITPCSQCPSASMLNLGLGFGLKTPAHAPGWGRGRWRAMRLLQPCVRS